MAEYFTDGSYRTSLLPGTEPAVKTISDKNGYAALVRVCHETESLFIDYLLKEMRATIPESGMSENGIARNFYTDISDKYLANELADNGGIGLSQILLRQLGRHGYE